MNPKQVRTNTRDSGSMACNTGWVLKRHLMEAYTKASGIKARNRGPEPWYTRRLVKCLRGNGTKTVDNLALA